MDYIVDVENKRLISSFRSTRSTSPEAVVFGDTPDISVRMVESNEGSFDLPWRYVDLTGYSIRVAIGNPGGDPTAGTFTLTFDGDTTAALDYDATAAEIDTELNGLASMVTAGGCTVSAVSAGYQVSFDTVGAQNIITATTDGLFPSSSAYIYESITGDGSTNEVQVVTLEVDNSAYVELTTDIAAPSATVTTVREGVTATTSELQRVEISGDPYLGTWSVTIAGSTSAAIAVDADLADITTAIEGIAGIGAGNVVVTGSVLDFTIQFAASLGNVGTAVIDVANLTGSVGKTGSLDLNTNQMLELLAGAASASSTLEIVKYDTGNSTSSTVLQQAITCRQDVIPDSPASVTPFPTYAAASHTHTESDITDLGTAVTLNADTNLVGNGWFLDTDTLSEDDAEKVPSQQSVKAYVDTQIAGLGSSMVFLGSYDANTTDPTDGDIGGTYVVTVAGTGVASFWTNALEVGDVIIQENATATTEADWVVVSRDIIPASEMVAGVVELATQAEVNTGTDTTRAVTPDTLSNYSGFPTGTPEGTAILSTAETVGKLLQADGDNTCSWVAAPSGTPEGTAILSTGEVGGTKFLREDGDGTCSWQAAAGGGLSNVVEDTTPQLGGDLDTNGNAIVTLSNADIELTPNGTGSVLKTAYSTTQRNGNFATAGDAQAESFVLRCQTTSATPVTMTLDGASAEMTMTTDSTWAFKGLVVARRGTTQDCGGYEFNGLIENDDGLGTSNLLTSTVTAIHEDDAGWNLTVTANGTGLRLQAVGSASEDINWVAYVTTVQTTNATTYY